jgi:hypothetical protein
MMKKLLMLLALVMVFGVGTAMAQNYIADINGDTNADAQLDLAPLATGCFNVYLDNAPAQATSGGVWVAYATATSDILFVSAARALSDSSEGLFGPWDAAAGGITPDANGVGTIQIVVGQTAGGGAAPVDGKIIVAQVCMQSTGPVDAPVRLRAIPGFTTWGPNPPYVDADITAATANPTLIIHQVCACLSDADCDDGLYCNGSGEICDACACVGGTGDPCDTGNVCTTAACDEDNDVCLDATCITLSGPTDPCCADEICAEDPICGAEITLIKEAGYYQPPASDSCLDKVTIKNKVCLSNPDVLVGGIQFDICDEPNCLECINCELTERTVMFDCVVAELENGCCRVIMFCKNPGCAINPGLCDIVTVVQQTKCEPVPPECVGCITETFSNIIASDYNGYELANGSIPGTLCPLVCGDVCPAGAGGAQDCGDGIIDIYDIMCEVNLALAADLGAAPDTVAALGNPNACQGTIDPASGHATRIDVPTGTPGFDELLGEEVGCAEPDGYVTIMDVMVLIDAALNRQDCCSYYYLGLIY